MSNNFWIFQNERQTFHEWKKWTIPHPSMWTIYRNEMEKLGAAIYGHGIKIHDMHAKPCCDFRFGFRVYGQTEQGTVLGVDGLFSDPYSYVFDPM